MNTLIVGFTMEADQEVGRTWTRLDQGLVLVGAQPIRHWQVEDANYLVIDNPPAPEELARVMQNSNVELTGAARLAFGSSAGTESEQAPATNVLPDEIDTKLNLSAIPGEGYPLSPELEICRRCGGMNGKHRYPHD